MNNNDFGLLSFFSIITVFYFVGVKFHFVEVDRWLNPKGFSLGGGLPEVLLYVKALVFFWLLVFAMFF